MGDQTARLVSSGSPRRRQRDNELLTSIQYANYLTNDDLDPQLLIPGFKACAAHVFQAGFDK
jgi:hypothetical protein